jgi:6-pyruvoyltetrahydropterin/6-carboxytetrahydropterin synthase
MITLSRRYHFSASHRLHSPHLSAEENTRLYGKCNNPYGHGHNYALEITVTGEIDQRTGVLVPVPSLDRLVEEKILSLFAYRNLNTEIPQFAKVVPTTENVVKLIAEEMEANWKQYLGEIAARLHRVRVEETARNTFELVKERDESSIFA